MTLPGAQPPAAPGQPYPYGPPAKPPNPKLAWWTSGPGIVAIFVIAGAIALALLFIVRTVQGPASDDFRVAVTSCNASGSANLATATVGLSVENTSSRARSATVKIEYRDAGGARIDTDTAYVRDIAPGDTARAEESTLLDAAPTGSITCKVTGIS